MISGRQRGGRGGHRAAVLAGVLALAAAALRCAPPPPVSGEAPVAVVPAPSADDPATATATAASAAPVDRGAPSAAPLVEAEPATPVDAAPPAPDPVICEPATPVAGFDDCEAVEVTGEPPCEAFCRRPRRLSAPNRCCERPVEVVVLSGVRVLLRVAACDFVPPDCADVHGHGNMDSDLRVLQGPPPEILVVEGGCEMRAMAHGYVPPGVAAWTGCRHKRYRWDGKRLVEQAR